MSKNKNKKSEDGTFFYKKGKKIAKEDILPNIKEVFIDPDRLSETQEKKLIDSVWDQMRAILSLKDKGNIHPN